MASRNQRRNKRNNKPINRSTDAQRDAGRNPDHDGLVERRRSSVETKASRRTTELMAYGAAVLAVVITALAVDDDGQGGAGDPFGAEHALRYITFLTIGYMVARGLAKAGSREHHRPRDIGPDDAGDDDGDDGVSDRDADRTRPDHRDTDVDDDEADAEDDVVAVGTASGGGQRSV